MVLNDHVKFQLYLFGFRLAKCPLVNSPNIDKQLLFPKVSLNCTLSTFIGLGVEKCVSKENPKSILDLDLGFVKRIGGISTGKF